MLIWLLTIAGMNVMGGLLMGLHSVLAQMAPEEHEGGLLHARSWLAWWCAGLGIALPVCAWWNADTLAAERLQATIAVATAVGTLSVILIAIQYGRETLSVEDETDVTSMLSEIDEIADESDEVWLELREAWTRVRITAAIAIATGVLAGVAAAAESTTGSGRWWTVGTLLAGAVGGVAVERWLQPRHEPATENEGQ